MTGWPLVATVVVAASTGTLTAYIIDAVREKSRNAEVAEEIRQRHRAGGHVRTGGRGPCRVCGDKGE